MSAPKCENKANAPCLGKVDDKILIYERCVSCPTHKEWFGKLVETASAAYADNTKLTPTKSVVDEWTIVVLRTLLRSPKEDLFPNEERISMYNKTAAKFADNTKVWALRFLSIFVCYRARYSRFQINGEPQPVGSEPGQKDSFFSKAETRNLMGQKPRWFQDNALHRVFARSMFTDMARWFPFKTDGNREAIGLMINELRKKWLGSFSKIVNRRMQGAWEEAATMYKAARLGVKKGASKINENSTIEEIQRAVNGARNTPFSPSWFALPSDNVTKWRQALREANARAPIITDDRPLGKVGTDDDGGYGYGDGEGATGVRTQETNKKKMKKKKK
jgi:hypothetical protein